MRRRRELVGLVSFLLLSLASVHGRGLEGVGLSAVTDALGYAPQTEGELRAALEESADLRERNPEDPEVAFRWVVLRLNDADYYELRPLREVLAEAVVKRPDHRRSFGLWDALVPSETELRLVDKQLKESGITAFASLNRAWIALRLGDAGRARELAARALRSDPQLDSLARLVQMLAAFHEEKDERGTVLFQELSENLNETTAELLLGLSSYALTERELREFDNKLPGDRGAWFRSVWRRRNPFPLTPANERLGEHLRRLHEARERYPLKSNGRGYLTLHNVFKELSPDLPYYSSSLVFDYVARRPYWLDHRGLVSVRHGAPDLSSRIGTGGERSETWLHARHTATPLLFHFVDRLGVGEFVLTLNLAQAMARAASPEDPEEILYKSRNFQGLYERRMNFHRLFQAIAYSRSARELEGLLIQEAQMMSGFIKQVWLDDTSTLLDRDDRLAFGAMSASFAGEGGKTDLYVYYAVPENEIDLDTPKLEFEAELVLYSRDWLEELARGTHSFEFERPPNKRGKRKEENLLVGVIKLQGLEPGTYSYAFQIREKVSGLVGVSKGRETIDYYAEPWVDLSHVVVADRVEAHDGDSIFERKGIRVVPIPTRVVKRTGPVSFYFEIYDLATDMDGQALYEADYRILKIQGERGFFSKLFGLGMTVAGVFFPYYTFLTRAGLFGLDILTTGPEEGLAKEVELHNLPRPGPRVSQVYNLDARKMDKGIYQFYVTVRDKVNGSISTRSVRFAITD